MGWFSVETRPTMRTRRAPSLWCGVNFLLLISSIVDLLVWCVGLGEPGRERQRRRPQAQRPLDLLPEELGGGVGVDAGYSQRRLLRRRPLVAQRLLADQEVDVRLLQQCGERVPPALGAGRGQAGSFRDSDERGAD